MLVRTQKRQLVRRDAFVQRRRAAAKRLRACPGADDCPLEASLSTLALLDAAPELVSEAQSASLDGGDSLRLLSIFDMPNDFILPDFFLSYRYLVRICKSIGTVCN